MLKILRNKKTAKKIWVILALLIVPAFVLWGSSSLFRSRQGSDYAGRIFGRNILFSEYKDAFDATRIQAIMQFGDNFPEIEKYLNLETRAWQRIILLQEAKKERIKAQDLEVIELIESYPFLKNSKGQFDNRIYLEMLRYVFRTQARAFEEQTRQNIILSKLYDKVTSGIQINENELFRDYQRLNQEISIFYISSIPGDFTQELTVTDEEVKDYFLTHTLEFKQPASFNIEYLSLEISNQQNDSLTEKMKNVRSLLNKKDGLSLAAKELGVELKESGLFTQTDPIPGIGWSPQISNMISKLKVSQISSPIQTDKYYYILRLKERKDPYIPEFEGIKDRVKSTLLKQKSQELAREKINACDKRLKETYQSEPKSLDFEKIAGEYALKSKSTGLFKYGSYIEGIGASDSFWTEAQRLKGDEPSGVISLSSGFYIIKPKEKTPLDEKRFQAEKNEFKEKLLLQKKQDYFNKFLEDLIKKSGANSKLNLP